MASRHTSEGEIRMRDQPKAGAPGIRAWSHHHRAPVEAENKSIFLTIPAGLATGRIWNSTALRCSAISRLAIDAASSGWLGLQSSKETIRESGLWNSNHVEKSHDPAFLEKLRTYAMNTGL
jgi:hypothetical protein